MIRSIFGFLTIIIIGVTWSAFLLLTPLGWHRIYLAIGAIFSHKIRVQAFDVWCADDKFFNEKLGGRKGHTISGRVGYKAYKGDNLFWHTAEKTINFFFWFQPNHCYKSINWELFDK